LPNNLNFATQIVYDNIPPITQGIGVMIIESTFIVG